MLVEKNIRLAYFVANSFQGSMELEELQGCALLGLAKAAATFKPELGVKFATFAVKVMRNEILMSLRKERRRRGTVYLDDPIGSDDGSLCIADILPDKQRPFQDLEALMDLNTAIEEAGRELSDLERQILHIMVYNPGFSQSGIGDKLKISQSYVSRCAKKIKMEFKKKFVG